MQYSSVRAVSAAAYAGRVPYWRAYSTEEAVPEETVSGEEPAAAAAAAPERVGTTGGPFRVMVTGVPTEVLNRDVRVFLGRAGHVCWIRRVRAEHNDGNAVVIVEYLTEEEAQAAVETLNGEEMDGEALTVAPDTSGLVMELPARLMLKNLPYSFDEFQIRELVSGYDVAWVNMINNDRGFSGMATVKFATQEQAKLAMAQLVNAEADGRRLIASFAAAARRDDGGRALRRPRFNDGGDRGDRGMRREGGFRRREEGSRGGYENRHFDDRRNQGDNGGKRYSNNNYFDQE